MFRDQVSAGYPSGKWSYKGNTLTIGWGEKYDEVSKFTVESLSSTEMQLHYKYSEDEYVYDWVVTFVRVDSDDDDHE